LLLAFGLLPGYN